MKLQITNIWINTIIIIIKMTCNLLIFVLYYKPVNSYSHTEIRKSSISKRNCPYSHRVYGASHQIKTTVEKRSKKHKYIILTTLRFTKMCEIH